LAPAVHEFPERVAVGALRPAEAVAGGAGAMVLVVDDVVDVVVEDVGEDVVEDEGGALLVVPRFPASRRPRTRCLTAPPGAR
jgi:hypothetical protein